MKDYQEMMYSPRHDGYLLASHVYKGYEYVIKSYGSHPCCYINIPTTDIYYRTNDYGKIPISVHGGLTYLTHDGLRIGEGLYISGHWIGWDYAHVDDHVEYNTPIKTPLPSKLDKRWTTKELISECRKAIDQLISLNYERKKNAKAKEN